MEHQALPWDSSFVKGTFDLVEARVHLNSPVFACRESLCLLEVKWSLSPEVPSTPEKFPDQ
jgi:hypothetical protein